MVPHNANCSKVWAQEKCFANAIFAWLTHLNFWKKSWKRKAYRSNNMAKYKAINEQDRYVACGVCVKVCPKDAWKYGIRL